MKKAKLLIMKNKIALVGSGGHATSLIGILSALDIKVDYVVDIKEKIENPYFENYQYIQLNEFFLKIKNYEVKVINGLGMNKPLDKRYNLYTELSSLGYKFIKTIHPSVITHVDTYIDDGVQIFANCVIQNNTIIKSNTIVNTSVSIDHDSIIHENCHICPGVIICGHVEIGSNSMIGAGSIILPGSKIAESTLVKAGSVINNKNV